MVVERAVFEGQVAGAAAGAVGHIGIVVPLGVDMTAQAPATKQIVGKGKRGIDDAGKRDVRRRRE